MTNSDKQTTYITGMMLVMFNTLAICGWFFGGAEGRETAGALWIIQTVMLVVAFISWSAGKLFPIYRS